MSKRRSRIQRLTGIAEAQGRWEGLGSLALGTGTGIDERLAFVSVRDSPREVLDGCCADAATGIFDGGGGRRKATSCLASKAAASMLAEAPCVPPFAMLICDALVSEAAVVNFAAGTLTSSFFGSVDCTWTGTVSYTHLTLPTICSV